MQIDRITTQSTRKEYPVKVPALENTFQSVMEKATGSASGFIPAGDGWVVDAWNATKEETGIDPMPMNRISTAMVLYVESGRKTPFASFLGGSIASAAQMAERIVYRLQHPIAPVSDMRFAKDEMTFYQCFLKKLAR